MKIQMLILITMFQTPFLTIADEKHDVEIVEDEETEIEEKKKEEEKETVEDSTEEEIVVTGTKTEKLVSEAPVKTSVVGKAEMEKKNAANLADAIDNTTGVRVENNCQNCGFNQVRLNGLDGHYSQILIDGKGVYSSLAGVYGLEHIPVQMIERVEIVKGGGSSLYGGSAVAGVINVITKKPSENFGNITLETQFIPSESGVDGLSKGLRLGGDAGLVTKDKKAALFVYGGGPARQPWDENDDGFSELGETRQSFGGSNAFLNPFKGGELQGKFSIMRDSRRGGDHFLRAKHKSEVAESTDTDRWGGEVKWKHEILSTKTDYEMSYGFAYTERSSYYGGDDQFGDMYGKTKNPMHVLDASINQLANFLGVMMFTGGFQYTHEDLDDYTADGLASTDETYSNIGGLIQIDWMPKKWVEIIMGVRIDKHSELDVPVFSPRATLMFSHRDFKSRTSFSTGFRAPQIFDEDFHITVVQGEPSPTVNSDDLNAEKSWNISQQFEYKFTKNGFSIKPSINGYLSQIYDAFNTKDIEESDSNYEEGINKKIRYNSGTTTSMGIELDIEMAYKKLWTLDIGWTFEKAENSKNDEDLAGVGINEKRVLKTPNFYGYIAAALTPWKGLEFTTALNLTGPMKIKHEEDFNGSDFELTTSDWFADWNIGIGYKFKADSYSVKPYFTVKNVLNSFQDDFDEGAGRDAGYIYGPRSPRTFVLGIKGEI